MSNRQTILANTRAGRALVARPVRAVASAYMVGTMVIVLGAAAIIVPQLTVTCHCSRESRTAATLNGLATALETFRAECGRFPTTDEGIAALLTNPGSADIGEKWAGPYLTKRLHDGWFRDLCYSSPGQFSSIGYDLWSVGPDAKSGTEDDIVAQSSQGGPIR